MKRCPSQRVAFRSVAFAFVVKVFQVCNLRLHLEARLIPRLWQSLAMQLISFALLAFAAISVVALPTVGTTDGVNVSMLVE